MAYLPAGEENDYDSDDWDLEDFNYNNSSSGPKNAFTTQHVEQSQTSTSTSGQKSNWPSSGQWTPNFDAWSNRNTYLTTEDLQRAAVRGNLDVIEKCLTQGIPVDEVLRQGWTALMFAGNYAQVKVVEMLLKNRANPKHSIDMFSPLMATCNACSGTDEHIGECIRLLVESDADVNAKDRYHMTSLMLACREGHLSAVKQLLKLGAHVNAQDSKGWTALTFATQRQRKAIVVELLDAGADCNIQHLDKLTVKDLAAHLPSDEMLALLERRPANIVNSCGDTVVDTSKTHMRAQMSGDASYSTLDSGVEYAKLTDLRYGELEVFLIGLDLPHLVPLFQQQLIDLTLLLTLTEQDFINAGVSQVGARKKILDAVQAIHKKDWEPSSLVSIHYNKKITCADAVAMVANSSKHVRYIGSTMMYVKGQLRKHPESIMLSTDKVTPNQLMRHTEDAMRNAITLVGELQSLQKELKVEMTKRHCKPPDLLEEKNGKLKRISLVASISAVTLTLASFGLVLLKRDRITEYLSSVAPNVFIWVR